MVTRSTHELVTESREEIAARLRIAIARASRRLRQEARPGLTPSLTCALDTINQHGPLTPSDLAARERLARPGTTRLIARLESEGLVTCEPDPLDGRSYTIVASARGSALLGDARRRSKAFLSRALRELDERQLATLAEAATILERLVEDKR
jgi:DNA-binding MarR family transcriptional regulator